MNSQKQPLSGQQQDLFQVDEQFDEQQSKDEEVSRPVIDQLLSESKLYRTSKDYKDFLDFVLS